MNETQTQRELRQAFERLNESNLSLGEQLDAASRSVKQRRPDASDAIDRMVDRLKEGGADKAVVPANSDVGSRNEQSFIRLRGFMESSRLLHEMPKPTIAMVNGPVAGAGIGLAGACDLRFAGRSASFLTAFDRIGAGRDFGSTWFWTKILGTGVARKGWLTKGDVINTLPLPKLRKELAKKRAR